MPNSDDYEDLIDNIDEAMSDPNTNPEEVRDIALSLASSVLGSEYAECLDKSTTRMNKVIEETTEAIMEILTFAEKSFDDGSSDRIRFCSAGIDTLKHVLQNELMPRLNKASQALGIVMGFVEKEDLTDMSVSNNENHWDFNLRS